MPLAFANNAKTTLASGITDVATSLTVQAGKGALFPSTAGSTTYYCTLENSSAVKEIVKVTAKSTDTFTVVRAQQGTTGTAYSAGDEFSLRLTSAGLTEYIAEQVTGLAEWTVGPTPTYISATSFSLATDLTTTWTPGRRVKATVTAGALVYGTIKTSVFTSVTTITIDDDVLDSNLSAVAYGTLTATAVSRSLPALPATDITGNISLAESTDFPAARKVTNAADITLPLAARVAVGKITIITSRTEKSVKFLRSGSDTINGLTADFRIPGYQSVTVMSDGVSDWAVISPYDCWTGDIKAITVSSPPQGWILADGTAVSRVTYGGLFAVIGTTYGVGDGVNTFNVPDLRGRTVIGIDGAANRITSASTGGSQADSLGGVGGAETHTLSTTEMPSHTHSPEANRMWFNTTGGTQGPAAGPFILANPGNVGNTGGGGAHSNTQPWIALTYCIKT